jgi:hypothetical protein
MNKTVKEYLEREALMDSLIFDCDCSAFQSRIGLDIDKQDLRELNYRHCPFCKKDFKQITHTHRARVLRYETNN